MNLTRSIIREPLVHFLIAGLVLFAAAGFYRTANDSRVIKISEADVSALEEGYEAEFGAAPEPAVTEQLLKDYIQSEVLYREGLARGVAHGDQVIRRRIIQKVAFLETGLADVPTPSERKLLQWFQTYEHRYATQPRVTFRHVFFAEARQDEAKTRQRARAALSIARSSSAIPQGGDPFADQNEYSDMTVKAARNIFGDNELSTKLFSVPVGEWQGPFRSGFGYHVVYVESRVAGHKPIFEDVRQNVLNDYIAQARKKIDSERLARLRAKYKIIRNNT